MTETKSHQYDPYQAALELREQTSPGRKLAFLVGAGASMAAGIPSILALTDRLRQALGEPHKSLFDQTLARLGDAANVEDVLNRVRLYRELVGESDDYDVSELPLSGRSQVDEFDYAICQQLCKEVRTPPDARLDAHRILAQWVGAIRARRRYSLEIFTPNYDTLLERAFEDASVPFFDGFVGSVRPFFSLESVETTGSVFDQLVQPPPTWSLLWKLHGSINWRVQRSPTGRLERVIRVATDAGDGAELVVFPSREKYQDSRKLPFLALQDRLRRFLARGERLLVVIGYSFNDEHINEILFSALQNNPSLTATALVYGESRNDGDKKSLPSRFLRWGHDYRNFVAYGPDRATIGGRACEWTEPSSDHEKDTYWDADQEAFRLGDFESFASFLERFIGFRQSDAPAIASDLEAGEGSEVGAQAEPNE